MKTKFNTTDEPLRIIKKRLYKYFKGNCLDIGTDNGRNLFLMPKGSTGLDFYDDYFEDIGKKGYKAVKHNFNDGILPFEDNSFDCVLFSHVLEHLEMPSKSIKEIHRVLKEDGILVIGVPNAYCIHTNFYTRIWDFHINVYDGRVLKLLLEKNDFEILGRYCNFPLGNTLSYLLFNYTPLMYIMDDVFFVCKKKVM